MENFLNSVINRCNAICDLAYDIIEEVQDGNERSAMVLSSIEAVYSLQDLVRAYMLRYPKEFSGKVFKKAIKFLGRSPEVYLRSKLRRRHFQNELSVPSDLPF